MRMVAEYLEHVLQFERMAAEATDPTLKESFLKQAAAGDVLIKTCERTRSGWSCASTWASAPPIDTPTTCADGMPCASYSGKTVTSLVSSATSGT